jgi:hypothetical protein
MQDPANDLRRIFLPRTPLNRGKKRRPRLLQEPRPFLLALCSYLRAALLYQSTYSARWAITQGLRTVLAATNHSEQTVFLGGVLRSRPS